MNPLNAKFTVFLFLTIITYIFSESISLKYHFILFFKKNIYVNIWNFSNLQKEKKNNFYMNVIAAKAKFNMWKASYKDSRPAIFLQLGKLAIIWGSKPKL